MDMNKTKVCMFFFWKWFNTVYTLFDLKIASKRNCSNNHTEMADEKQLEGLRIVKT